MGSDLPPFWGVSADELLKQLNTSMNGLTESDAENRLKTYGPNTFREKKESSAPTLLLSQFKSPIILILIAAAFLSLFLHDFTDSAIILSIVLVSGLLGFFQEH